jgi:hypothetical protein
VVRLRSVHGFMPTPQKPNEGWVSWKVKRDSGSCITVSLIARVEIVTCSIVEFAGVFTIPSTTP